MSNTSVVEIAHFSMLKSVLAIFVTSLFLLFLISISFHGTKNQHLSLSHLSGSLWFSLLPVAWLCTIAMLALFALLLRQIVFRRGLAVWVDQGALIFLSRHYFRVSVREVSHVLVGSFAGSLGSPSRPAIVLELRDGQKKFIPTSALREDPMEIRARLVSCL